MPNDFTASVLEIVKVKQHDLSKTQALTNPELNNNPLTQAMVLGKQSVNVTPIIDNTTKECVGVRGVYQVADSIALPTVSLTPIASTAVIGAGDGSSSKVQNFELNYFAKPKITLKDKDCDNFVKFTDKVAFMFTEKMALLAQALNLRIINDVETHKSVPSAVNLPTGVTVSTGDYAIISPTAWVGVEAADTLVTLDLLAATRGLPDNYYILSGSTLRISSELADNKQVNDNQQSFVRLFNRKDISYDVNNLDTIIGEGVIYLIDPRVIATFFVAEYPDTPESFQDEENTMRFRLPVTYPSNHQNGDNVMATLQFAVNGQMQDVMVDVRYQRRNNVIPAETKNGKPSLTHNWEFDMQGMIEFFVSESDNTGIIRVDQT